MELLELVLETTKKSPISDTQNLELTPDVIDAFFENNQLSIHTLCFRGVETTLNLGIIRYTIHKIIRENMEVETIQVVTDNQTYHQELVDVLNEFNEYRNQQVMIGMLKRFSDIPEQVPKLLKCNMNYHAEIILMGQSTDISNTVKKRYRENGSNLRIVDTGYQESGSKTLQANGDICYSWKTPEYINRDNLFVATSFYITASGNITTFSDCIYRENDMVSLGSVYETTIEDILIEYGEPIFDTPRLESKLQGLRMLA